MGNYAQLRTPDGSMADVSSLDTATRGKIASRTVSGEPSVNDIEESTVQEDDTVVKVVEADDCLGWGRMMGPWPILSLLAIILIGGGIGVGFSQLMICSR